MVYERMNQITGVRCNEVQGAMYAFPRVDIPEEAWEDAQVSHNTRLHVVLIASAGVCVFVICKPFYRRVIGYRTLDLVDDHRVL